MNICSVPECERLAHARGFCHRHYIRERRRGLLPKRTPEERFSERFTISPDACWLWTGEIDAKGYPLFAVKDRKYRAHRWAWERYVAALEPGQQLHHLCRRTSCVNPDHLEPMYNHENQRRRWDRSYCCADCGSRNVVAVFGDQTDDLDLTVT